MREIKFRAWDEQNKVMHYNFQFIKTGNDGNDWIVFTSDKQTLGWDELRQEEKPHPLNNPYFSQQLKIVQFTGLKDKNGKEIYEGDVVSDEKTIYVVEYNTQQSGFWIIAQKTISDEPFVLMTLNSNTLGNGYYDRKDLEVIGNIYENPELIK